MRTLDNPHCSCFEPFTSHLKCVDDVYSALSVQQKLSCVENHRPSVTSVISCKASRDISFPTGWARPWTYGTNIIITLPIQRDCPAPIPPTLIGQTAGNQDRKHRGITQASGAASQSRWMTRCQRLQACNSAFSKMFTSGLAPRGTADGLWHIVSGRHRHYACWGRFKPNNPRVQHHRPKLCFTTEE